MKRLDLETGIYFFRARFYHAELGRFVSRDPIGYVDGMTLYRPYFVPNGIDPSGLDLSDVIDGIIDGYATGEAARRSSPVGPLDLGEVLSGQVDAFVDLLDGFAETGHPCNKYFRRLLTVLSRARRRVKSCEKNCTDIELSIDESTGTKNGKDCIASLSTAAARGNLAKKAREIAQKCFELCRKNKPKPGEPRPDEDPDEKPRKPKKPKPKIFCP